MKSLSASTFFADRPNLCRRLLNQTAIEPFENTHGEFQNCCVKKQDAMTEELRSQGFILPCQPGSQRYHTGCVIAALTVIEILS